MDKKLMPFWEAVQRSMERRAHPTTFIAKIKKGAKSALIDTLFKQPRWLT
jgi:hypothetical protein